MLDYFTSSILAAILWGGVAVAEGYMGKKSKEVGLFFKFLILGIAAIFFFFFFKKKIIKDTIKIWNNNNMTLFYYIWGAVIGAIFANYFYWTALEESADRANIVIAITWTLPIVIAAIIMNLFFNEKTNIPSMIGIALILSGVLILKLYNPVEKNS